MKEVNFCLIKTTNILFTTQSSVFDLRHRKDFSIEVIFTTDANFSGSFVVEAANSGKGWHTLAETQIASGSDTCLFNIDRANYRSVRLNIKPVTGSILELEALIYLKED